MEAVNQTAQNLQETIQNTTDRLANSAEDTVDGTERKLKRGINNARNHVKQAAGPIV